MTAWTYVAVDAAGRRQVGEVEADHLREARSRLREMGLLPETVAQREERSVQPGGFYRRRVGATDLALFAQQFATLLIAGLTIEKALAALSEQPDQEAMQRVLWALREDVVAGHDLATAMGRQPSVFPPFFAAIVRAGAEAGALPQVMERLASYLERMQALRQRVGMALVYPAIVTVVAVLVVGILLTYVVPQVVGVFEHARQQLPWLTRALIGVSDALRAVGWVLPVVAVGVAIAVHRLLAREAWRHRWHALLLRLPLVGRFRTAVSSARLANTLGVLLASGVPVVTALAHVSRALDDRVFRAAVEQASTRVQEGLSLSRALRESGVFPSILVHLVASGEASGELPHVLGQAARQQEQIVETRLSALVTLLEPLLILSMGLVVLLIVLGTLEPIIDMNRLLH